MKKFCAFPEIGQYRNIVRTVTERARYVGKVTYEQTINQHYNQHNNLI